MKKILVVLCVICTASVALAKDPTFKDEKLQAMSELILGMGGNGYVGNQTDGTAIGCVIGIKKDALAHDTAKNRARAFLAFKLGRIAFEQYLKKEPNGKKPSVTFQAGVTSGINTPTPTCKPYKATQICCARAIPPQ